MKLGTRNKRAIETENLKKNIMKHKYTILLAMLLVLILLFMIRDKKVENPSIKFYGVDQRVDISYTYKKLNEGIYKAYPGVISMLKYSEEGLRIECLAGAIISMDLELPIIDSDYEELITASEIYLMEVWSKVEIKVDGQDVSMTKLISSWKEIKDEIDETPSKLGSSLIQIKTDNQKIIAIHLDTK